MGTSPSLPRLREYGAQSIGARVYEVYLCHSPPSNSTQAGVINLQVLKGSLFSLILIFVPALPLLGMPFLLFFPKPITSICPSKASTVAPPAKKTCLQFTHVPACCALNVSPKSSYFVGQPNNPNSHVHATWRQLGTGTVLRVRPYDRIGGFKTQAYTSSVILWWKKVHTWQCLDVGPPDSSTVRNFIFTNLPLLLYYNITEKGLIQCNNTVFAFIDLVCNWLHFSVHWSIFFCFPWLERPYVPKSSTIVSLMQV